jgi:hypothetical protein
MVLIPPADTEAVSIGVLACRLCRAGGMSRRKYACRMPGHLACRPDDPDALVTSHPRGLAALPGPHAPSVCPPSRRTHGLSIRVGPRAACLGRGEADGSIFQPRHVHVAGGTGELKSGGPTKPLSAQWRPVSLGSGRSASTSTRKLPSEGCAAWRRRLSGWGRPVHDTSGPDIQFYVTLRVYQARDRSSV